MMNIKKSLAYFLFAIGFIAIVSCKKDENNTVTTPTTGTIAEGPIVTRTLSVADFTGVNLATSPGVVIKQGETQEIKAIGQSNIIDLVNTDVVDNVWKIDFKSAISGNFDLTIEITVPVIKSVVASSSGSISVEDFTDQSSLSVETKSSGSITLNKFEGITELSPVVGSSGNINANQDITTLENLAVNIASSGNFNGFPITSEDCTVNVTSNGDANITANNTLDVTISSSGNVYYKGNPTITQNITSSGMLIDAN